MYNSQANNPLYKGVTCPYCEKALRTRQGLSGHIQWKHGINQNTPDKALDDIELLEDKLYAPIQSVNTIGFGETTINAIEIILDNWKKILAVCEQLDIDLNKQDFKNYFVTMLANVYNQG